MPRLRRRGRVYYSDLYVAGKRIRRPLDTDRRLAEAKLADLIKRRDDARYGAGNRDISIEAFERRYLELNPAMPRATLNHVRRALRSLAGSERPVRTLGQVTPLYLQELRAEWERASRGRYVVERDLRTLKAMLRKAAGWGLISPQDWGQAKGPRLPRGRLRFWGPVELRRLFAACPPGLWRTFAWLGARAGLRPSEAYHLEPADVDLARGRLHVAPKAPGLCACHPAGWAPKDAERRYVPMFPDLRAFLTRVRLGRSFALEEPGGSRPTLGSLLTYFARLVRKAGLEGSAYTLRHSYGAALASAGIPLQFAQKWMGHSDIKTTMIYAHLAPESGDDLLARVPALGPNCDQAESQVDSNEPQSIARFSDEKRNFRRGSRRF